MMIKKITKLSLLFITSISLSLAHAENYTKIQYVCLNSNQTKSVLMLESYSLKSKSITDVMYYPYLKQIDLGESSGLGTGMGNSTDKEILWHYSYDELNAGKKVGIYDVLYRDGKVLMVTYNKLNGGSTITFFQGLNDKLKNKINHKLAESSRECL